MCAWVTSKSSALKYDCTCLLPKCRSNSSQESVPELSRSADRKKSLMRAVNTCNLSVSDLTRASLSLSAISVAVATKAPLTILITPKYMKNTYQKNVPVQKG